MSNIYHANFRSIEPRPSRQSNSIVFGATDDGAAAAVATELGQWTTGQLTSLTKRIGGVGTGGTAYPVGTRRSCSAYLVGSDGGIWKVRIRNIAPTVTEIDVAAFLMGIASTGSVAIVALGAKPQIPGTGVDVVGVTGVRFNTLS